jgi:hypothetical protein
VEGAIAAVSRIPNSMEVWWVGTGASGPGSILVRRPTLGAVSTRATRQRSGGIAAVSRVPDGMEVWWVGDASVEGAYWYEGQLWRRYQLAPRFSASVFSSVTAVSRIFNRMEVWWVGPFGSVEHALWHNDVIT